MLYKLPPLNALRAFEAAARHLSFKLAANELGVTPGAVGQQIGRLEQTLDVRLFDRLTRSVRLTEAGQLYVPAIRQAFAQISGATERIAPPKGVRALTVSVAPGFAAKWLVPRLGRFWECHSDIDVRISASPHLADFDKDGVDVAIRHGLGDYVGLASWRLYAEDMAPVCSPALTRGDAGLRHPSDLRRAVLLHDLSRRDWPMWLKAMGIRGVETARGPGFSDDGLILQAAIDGLGVALGRDSLVEHDIAEGRLVRPFGMAMPSAFAYYLVCPVGAADRPDISIFRDWLLQEARQEERAARR